MNWISVKDKLPELNKKVFVYHDDKSFGFGYRRDDYWVVNGNFSFDFGRIITHWCNPEPPIQ